MVSESHTKREFLRHTLATLAYRGAKTVQNAPPNFSTLLIESTSRTPVEILAHCGDLLEWALSIARGQTVWHDSPPLPWDREVDRFFETLKQFDAYLSSDQPLKNPPEKLFQGPIADALTHVGQIAQLRRIGDSPVRGENYFKAEIVAGRVGPDQSTHRAEFD